MPVAQGHLHRFVGIGADLFHLAEGGAGGHEAEGPAVDALHRLPPEGQAEPVHRDHGEPALADLKEGAGMDGTGLVGGHGEEGLADHITESILLNGEAELVLHLRQLRVVRGAEGGDVKGGVAAGQADVELVVGGKNHHIVRQAADDVTEEAGVDYQLAALLDLRADLGADAGLHVVAGDSKGRIGLEQQPLQGGDGAFGGDSPGCRVDGGLEQGFFTGETHGRNFLSKIFGGRCGAPCWKAEKIYNLL